MTLIRRRYIRRRHMGSDQNVFIFTPEGGIYDQVIGTDAWEKAGKIIDELNMQIYEKTSKTDFN